MTGYGGVYACVCDWVWGAYPPKLSCNNDIDVVGVKPVK